MALDQRVKYRHLQCFLEIARQRSVVKAAASLSVTQPAVSKTIRELEDLLGVALFERRGRGVALTRFGEVFLRYAGASVTALRQGIDSITQARTKGGMPIKVGALPTVSTRVMPLALQLFKQDNIGTLVRVVTGQNAVLLSQLRTGDLDLVVGRLADPELMTGLSFEYLYSERVCFVVRPGHPLLDLKPFDLAKVTDYTVLMPTEGSIIRPLVDRFLITHGIATVPDQIETVSMPFGRRYTRMTNAVWIISRGVVAEDMADGVLAELQVATADTTGPVGLTTRADIPPSLPAVMLMNTIREAAKRQGVDAATSAYARAPAPGPETAAPVSAGRYRRR
jgi:LysR family transcriptional regulator, pca operon transcriptional activator